MGDLLRTERGRTIHVDRIDVVTWNTDGGKCLMFTDEDTGGSVLEMAVVAVYRKPIWRRR